MTKTAMSMVALAAIATACGPRTQVVALQTTSAGGLDEHVCPMGMPGSRAREIDVRGGAALELTASSEASIDALRRRARAMASRGLLGRMAGPGGGIGVRGARRTAEGAPPADVRVEDIPGGVRVSLYARDPAQIDLLRARARAHAPLMGQGRGGAAGTCRAD